MGFLFGLGPPAIQTEPKAKPMVRPPYTARQENEKWIFLAPFIKEHFDTGDKSLKDIAADLALAAYRSHLKEKKKKDEQWEKLKEGIR